MAADIELSETRSSSGSSHHSDGDNSKPEVAADDSGSTSGSVKKGLSVGWAAVFVVANIAGSGVLPMPSAVVRSGWIGLVLIVLCCLVAGYLGTRLAKCWVFMEERNPEYRKGVRTPYAAIGYEAFGKPGRILVSVANNISLFGVSVVFLILCAQNLDDIIQSTLPADQVPEVLDFCLWLVIIAAALCPLTWLGSPKEFWWAGLLALLTTVVACILIIIQAAIDAPSQTDIHYPDPTFQSFFLAFGSILFAFGGASSFPTIQNDMTDKTKFVKSVNFAFIGLMLIFFPVAATGYFVYGGNVKDNILLSLSDGGPKVAAQILISLHVFFAFLIISNPVYQELEEIFKIPNRFGWKRVLLRTVLLLLALFVGESIPSFGKVLDLVGGSTVSLLTFILPPLFYMRLADKKGPWKKTIIPLHERVFLWEMVVVGVAGGVAATYSAILAIANGGSLDSPCYVTHLSYLANLVS